MVNWGSHIGPCNLIIFIKIPPPHLSPFNLLGIHLCLAKLFWLSMWMVERLSDRRSVALYIWNIEDQKGSGWGFLKKKPTPITYILEKNQCLRYIIIKIIFIISNNIHSILWSKNVWLCTENNHWSEHNGMFLSSTQCHVRWAINKCYWVIDTDRCHSLPLTLQVMAGLMG